MGKINFTTRVTIVDTEDSGRDEVRLDIVFVHGVGRDCITELGSAVIIGDTPDGISGTGTIGSSTPVQRINVNAEMEPNQEQPYVAVVVRAVEQDHSSEPQRRADRDGLKNRIQRSIRNLADTSPLETTRAIIRAARTAPLSDDAGDDDDFIDVAVFDVARYGEVVSRFRGRGRQATLDGTSIRFDDTSLRQGSAHYDLATSRVFFDPQPDLIAVSREINDATSLVLSDEGARAFITGHRSDELALLTSNSADRLLDLLFDGPTGGDEELAILKLVRSLPTTIVQDLEASHAKSADAYAAEVDGDNWRQLKAELSRSIAV